MFALRTFFLTVFGLSCVTHLAGMESINDVPEYYANLLDQSKNIIVDDAQQEYKIIEILDKNFPRFYKNYSVQQETYSQQELVNTYKSIILSLQANWLPVCDYRLHNEEFYDKWSLFYKYGNLLINEDKLILALAKKFGFEQNVSWRAAQNAGFLYVKKDILDRFNSVFNF